MPGAAAWDLRSPALYRARVRLRDGGAVVDTASVRFGLREIKASGTDILLNGKASAFYRSNGDAYGGRIAAGLANQYARLDYTGSSSQSRHYRDGNGESGQRAAALSPAGKRFENDVYLIYEFDVRGSSRP